MMIPHFTAERSYFIFVCLNFLLSCSCRKLGCRMEKKGCSGQLCLVEPTFSRLAVADGGWEGREPGNWIFPLSVPQTFSFSVRGSKCTFTFSFFSVFAGKFCFRSCCGGLNCCLAQSKCKHPVKVYCMGP